MKRLVHILIIIVLLVVARTVRADPSFPLPRLPICGDQGDGSITLHCADLIPIADVEQFQVQGTEMINLVFDFVFREANYNNELGFYILDDASGAVGGILPGEDGYLAAALGNATIVFPSGSNASTPDRAFEFNGGEILAFFIIQNSTLASFLANNPSNDPARLPLAFFSISELNPDETDHFVGFDSISENNTQFGFEDQTSGGDLDYDDVVYNVIPPMEPACRPQEWYAQYYSNRDLAGDPTFVRCDENIDFMWRDLSPGNDLPADDFSVRWTRVVDFETTGWYRFRTFTDDGSRLYLDGVKIIDDWVPHSFDERSVTRQIAQGKHQVEMEFAEWSVDAMAYLNWYLCPEGESDCSLNIAPVYQTNYLDIPMPAGCTTESNATIARWGCLITSASMALQQLGVEATPELLNTWLSEHEGYTLTTGLCAQSLIWGKIIEYAAVPEHGGVKIAFRGTTNATTTIREKGLPVVLHASKGHYLLAIDVAETDEGLTLGVNDPYHSWICRVDPDDPPLPPSSVLTCGVGIQKHATTLYEESNYAGTSTPVGYWEQNPDAATPSLQIDVQGTEVLLTDVEGHHTGYDSTGPKLLTEILDSFYFDAETTPPGENSSGALFRTLYLAEHAGGIYRLSLSDNEFTNSYVTSSNYTITLIGLDADFNMMQVTITNTIPTGPHTFIINFDPGNHLTIVPIITTLYLPIVVR